MFANGRLQSGGNHIDVTRLEPFTKDASGITGTGAFQTILSINGKGFLESFYALQTLANAGFTVRVTVDGVVKVLLVIATQSNPIGVASKLDILGAGTAGQSGFRNPNVNSMTVFISTIFKPYPTTDSSNGIILLGDSKIYFTSSLLLEISCVANYSYHYAGAYQ